MVLFVKMRTSSAKSSRRQSPGGDGVYYLQPKTCVHKLRRRTLRTVLVWLPPVTPPRTRTPHLPAIQPTPQAPPGKRANRFIFLFSPNTSLHMAAPQKRHKNVRSLHLTAAAVSAVLTPPHTDMPPHSQAWLWLVRVDRPKNLPKVRYGDEP